MADAGHPWRVLRMGGIDNNLIRKESLTDATWIASVKGWVSGIVNLGFAFSPGAPIPA